METLERIYEGVVAVLDIPLGWMLLLGRDLPVVLLAMGTALAMLLLRRRVSDQDKLQRCSEDRATLARRIREARRAKDSVMATRLRAARARISLSALRCEGAPLLASMIPILLLASWAYARLGHVPPVSGEPIRMHAEFDPAWEGAVAFILPVEGVEAPEGWVRIPHRAEGVDGEPVARAEWTLAFAPRSGDHVLTIRSEGAEATVPVRVDARTYAPPMRWFHTGSIRFVQTHLQERRFLGVIPGVPSWMLPPWLIAYLLMTVPFYFLFRRWLGIH